MKHYIIFREDMWGYYEKMAEDWVLITFWDKWSLEMTQLQGSWSERLKDESVSITKEEYEKYIIKAKLKV